MTHAPLHEALAGLDDKMQSAETISPTVAASLGRACGLVWTHLYASMLDRHIEHDAPELGQCLERFNQAARLIRSAAPENPWLQNIERFQSRIVSAQNSGVDAATEQICADYEEVKAIAQLSAQGE